MRKLQNGSYTESYFEPIDLTIHTKAPGKWKLIDMETLWGRCRGYNKSITLIKTDLDSIIGYFCPDTWKNTCNSGPF